MENPDKIYKHLLKCEVYKKDEKGVRIPILNTLLYEMEIRELYVNEVTYNKMKNNDLNKEDRIDKLEKQVLKLTEILKNLTDDKK